VTATASQHDGVHHYGVFRKMICANQHPLQINPMADGKTILTLLLQRLHFDFLSVLSSPPDSLLPVHALTCLFWMKFQNPQLICVMVQALTGRQAFAE
jgi:hypothetical protein